MSLQSTFLKSPREKSRTIRLVYVRITVDGISKECSTKRQWDVKDGTNRKKMLLVLKEMLKNWPFK